MATDGSWVRRARWTIYSLVLVVNLVQQPGRITFDTKLDLQVAPGEFLARSLQLWNPESTLGELQNQASGYLFPLGPVYLLGHLLHVPMWVWERGVSALLMIAAFEGMRRLALAWGGLGEWTALLAGLFYMVSPRFLSTVGALTGEALPTAVLPWTVLPLVLCLRGRLSVRRAVLLSVATIPFMGGQNATEVLAALVFPAVLLVVNGQPWATRLRMFGGWSVAAVAVSLWWVVPLLALGRYGSPFLDYVESARTTTDRIGWLSALRGTDHWVTFLALGDSSSWRAGLELASSRLLLVSTVVAAVIALLGLLSNRLPHRRALVVVLVLGLFALTAGSTGPAGSVLDAPWTHLLDGVLAPFRNVHKFDPVVRLALALGFGAAVGSVRRVAAQARVGRGRPVVATLVATAVLAVPVLAAGLPAFQGHLRDSAGFTAIPASWRSAAAYLNAQPEPVRTLVVPGSGFAVQTWGRTTDEPLQVIDAPPWSSRSQTPLMPAGTIRWLDQVEDSLAAGRPDPTLALVLARAGITHLVVRNDLDYLLTDAPRPEIVHRVLDGSPGLLNVARFGRSKTIYPAVEVYAVAQDSGDPRVRLYDSADAATVSGGAEVSGQLLGAGALSEDRAMLRATGRGRQSADVLTDSLQRVERNFGRVHDADSQVMTGADYDRVQRAAHDLGYGDGGATVARYSGITRVLASSSSGYADTLGPVLPEQGPYAAVDGSLLTSWVSAPFADPRGAWIELRFARPTVMGATSLQFDVRNGAGVRRVAVDTDSGRRTATVDLDGRVSGLEMETAPTRRIRFTVLDSNRSIRPVTLQEITIAGLEVSRTLVVPGQARAGTTMSFRSTVQRPACIAFYAGLNCDPEYQRLSVDSTSWARDVAVAESGTWRLTGTAVATGGDAVAALLSPLDPRKVLVAASSWFGGDAAVVPQNAFDGEPSTTWVAAASDRQPVLHLRWKEPRRITRIQPRLAPGAPGRVPNRMRVESDAGTQVVPLGRFGTGVIKPVRTTFLRLTLIRDGVGPTARPGSRTPAPVAVSELAIDGLDGLTYHADADNPTGNVCGFGPSVDVDGRKVLLKVRGTVGDVISGAPLGFEPCGGAARDIRINRGDARITVRNEGAFAVRDLTLTPAGESVPDPPSSSGRAVIRSWGSSHRSVQVDTADEALLAVTQSSNPGWIATLHGDRLTPVEVDGWMQGWRVPAGSRGTVELRFAPQPGYLAGLAIGVALALAAMVAAAWLLLRPKRSSRAERLLAIRSERPLRRPGVAVLLAGLALLSVPALLGGVLGLVVRSRRWSGVVFVVAAAVAGILAFLRLDTSLVAPEVADLLIAAGFGTMVSTIVLDATTGAPDDA